MTKTVLVPIADGIEDIESATIIDVLRRAGAEVTVASVSGTLQVTASRQMKFVADALIEDCADQMYDLIALPGGLPGAEHLRDCAILIDLLKAQKMKGRLYAAICASPAVALAPHGLLDNKQSTGYPTTQDKLPNAVADQRVVVDDNCITSQGPGTALEFAIELIRQLFDNAKAKQVADPMIVNF
ncbi:MAG: DJ-1 family glyoxalase III [Planctomycetota bacterium]|jgi:4-methyl-5(b-hydroxyethyl)-thiazole monophosphate biosynthesis